MRVSNMQSTRSYAKVANQYEIEHNGWEYFQSYQTLIAKKKGLNYVVSMNYNYSVTTSKYFTAWLREYGWSEDEIKQFKGWAKRQIGKKQGQSKPFGNCTVKLVQELKS